MAPALREERQPPRDNDSSPAIESRRISKEDAHHLHRVWKETGDERIYRTLYRALYYIPCKIAHQYTSRYPGGSTDVLRDICLPKYEYLLGQYKGDKPGGSSLRTYLFRYIAQACRHFFVERPGKSRRERRTLSLDAPRGDGSDPEYTLLGTDLAGEDVAEDFVSGSLRSRVSILYRAIGSTVLTSDQRLFAEERFIADTDTPVTLQEIADRHGLTREAIRQRQEKLRARLRGLMGDDPENMPTPVQYYLSHFFSGFYPDHEHMCLYEEIFSSVGIVFLEDGRIDLSASASNAFYVAVFPMADGSFQTGLQLLQSAQSQSSDKPLSLVDFFLERVTNSAILVLPPKSPDLTKKTKPDAELTPEDVLSAVRSPENLSALMDCGHFTLDEKGKWHVSISSRKFEKGWCVLNGASRNGSAKRCGWNLLDFCGISSKDQPGIQSFVEMVFGKDNVDFSVRKRGGEETFKQVDETVVLSDLRKPHNIELLRTNGVYEEDCACQVYIPVTKFFRIQGFLVNGKSISGLALFHLLNIPHNRDGLLDLCRRIFPSKSPVYWVYTNGESMDLPSEEDLFNDFNSPENIAFLRSKAQVMPDGKLLVDFSKDDFPGSCFLFGGKPIGFCPVMMKFERGFGADDILWLYQKVFGMDQVVTPYEVFRQKACLYLFNNFFPRYGIYRQGADGYIFPMNLGLAHEKIFVIDGQSYTLRQLAFRSLGPKAKASQILKVSDLFDAILGKPVFLGVT